MSCHGGADPTICEAGDAAGTTACPAGGQAITYTCVDHVTGYAELTSEGRTYWCSIAFDKSDDQYDCTTDPSVGNQLTISSVNTPGVCPCGAQVNIALGPACSYSCHVAD